jgi:hypothetical protein
MKKFLLIFCLLASPCFGQAWSGVISPARATDWTQAGLPGDVPPDASWTQAGATISPCGSSGSPVSPSTCGITSALASCGTNHYVLLGKGDFYLSSSITLVSNCVLRGSGSNQTRLHAVSGGNYECNGQWGLVCIIGSNTYGNGNCGVWPCPVGTSLGGIAHTANVTGGLTQGSTSITVDSATGVVAGVTPIVIDECDIGFGGNTSNFACGAPSSGNAGAVTAVTIGAGGSGYAVGDKGTIPAVGPDFGMYFGSNTATYQVTSVSGGAVTGLSIANGGFGYTYTQSGSPEEAKTTSGSGSGLSLNITAVGAYDTGSIMNCAVAMICTGQSPSNTSLPARSQEEVVIATAVSGSGPYTLTLNRAIAHNNWAASQGPKAWWGGATITNTGVEDMELDQSAYTGNCGHGGCMNAVGVNSAVRWWIVGVSSNVANYFHVNAWYTSNGLIRDSYFYETANKGIESYGIGCSSSCGALLLENNIIQGIVDPVVPNGTCTSCVFAYNFELNQDNADTAVMFASNAMHTSSTDYILEEGNVGSGVNLDATHGPHFLNTFFRNYFTGYEANEGVMPYQSTLPIIIDAYSRFNNLIGNVLGTSGYHITYKCAPTSALQKDCTGYNQYVTNAIYSIGWSHSDQLDYDYNPPTPNDVLVSPSTMIWGNYDTVSEASVWNGSEVPTSDAHFPNPVPSSHNLPASFYDGVTSAHPNCGTGLAFWKNPTTGTCPQYPSIGPDVSSGDIGSCTSGTYKWSRALASSQCAGGSFTAGGSTNGGYGNSNPAMRCYLSYMNGTPDGTGAFNSNFSASACYASDGGTSGGGGGSQAPKAPSDLTVIVN